MTQSWFSACSSARSSSEAESRDLGEMEGSIVESKNGFYHIHKLLDRGTSSHVFKCKNLATAKDVALKVHKNYALFENEINMQEIVSVLDPDKKSIVEFIETFTFNGHPCLVFELLDTSLFSMVLDKKWKTFSPSDIRPVAQQLLTAFDALKSIGVIHTDLKSDNIMLVNHTAAPFRVKLIDFGLSIITEDAPLSYGVALQPMGNRAPEVALGLPFSEAIDMWSLGCVLSFLYLGNYLFLANNNYNMLRSMIEVVGRIPDHLLTASKNTPKYFKRSDRDNDGDHPKWRLMTEREYQEKTGVRPESLPWSFKSLDDMVKLKPEAGEAVELEDREAFVDLLKCLLHMDPEHRITPEDALRHPFLTMSHLSEHKSDSLYVSDSLDKMKFCPVGGSDKSRSGPALKAANWRQKFCRLLGPKKTAHPLATPPPPPPAAEDGGTVAGTVGGGAPEAEAGSWWRRIRRVFGGGPPCPRAEVRIAQLPPEKKTWRMKICLFFRMNRIVPEPCRCPSVKAPSAKPPPPSPRAPSAPPAPSPNHGDSCGVRDAAPSSPPPPARDRSPSRVGGKRSFRVKGRTAVPDAPRLHSSPPPTETARRAPTAPVPGRLRRDEGPRPGEERGKTRATTTTATLKTQRGGNGRPSSPPRGRRTKTAEEATAAAAAHKQAAASPAVRSRAAPTERPRLQKDKADPKRTAAAARGAAGTRDELTLDLNYLRDLPPGTHQRKNKKMT
ncbi:homeodomain-interacting protein kinase 3-like [Stigmatopora nigra]